MGQHEPQQIGPYTIVREVGRGGMGVAYQALDTRLDRFVALKSLPPDMAHYTEAVERFKREARSLAAVNHPNIAIIFGIEQHDEAHYLVLEYVEGENLAQRLGRGRMGIDETLALGRQMAEALDAAHERGIVHRDLKPGNVRITPQGRVKVLDFGLARRMTAGAAAPGAITQKIDAGEEIRATVAGDEVPTRRETVTGRGEILDTLGYMSPEHWAKRRSRPPGKRARR